MSVKVRTILAFGLMACLLLSVALGQSWSVALAILNLCLISAIMALGVNIQWGYAGLFNVGVMGFAALGGVAAVLVSKAPVVEAWQVGGSGLLVGLLCVITTIVLALLAFRKLPKGRLRPWLLALIIGGGYFVTRYFFDPTVEAIEAVDAAKTGYLGGMGLPIILSWIVGGALAAGAAWIVGKVALGLRSDYLAIATLGISEIIIAVLKNEDWLTRGVKNVSGLERPVPYEIELQSSDWFINLVYRFNDDGLSVLSTADRADALQQLVIESSSVFVKLCYAGLFAVVLGIILLLSAKALNSPWGRMMRAIRDNEVSANAMGKNITARHLQVFVLGSAVVGVAGAMLTTLDGQFTPGTYNPLRFTFLIWVMVIVGGSGNNLGAVLGGFVIWFFWVEAEPMGVWIVGVLTSGFSDTSFIRMHMMDNAQHMRHFMMGLVLLLVMRFSPGGILPEVIRRPKLQTNKG